MIKESIWFNLDPIETTVAFPYLDSTVIFNNSEWADLYGNLRKDQWRWGMIAKVLKNTVLTVWERAMMYKKVVQTVLFYKIEGWVVMEVMLNVLEGFHD